MRAPRSLFLVALLFPFAASAIQFPDVSMNSPNAPAIGALVEAGVINGNPDGTFKPSMPVNRAALLKMLYKASGKTPDPNAKGCFPKEIPTDVWYAQYVCDAVMHSYVQGYVDGTFKPNNTVTFAEATKMALTVFGMPVADVRASQILAMGLLNVDVSGWYGKYLVAAVRAGILLLPAQTAADFHPNDPVSRQQAASLVYQAMNAASASSSSSSVSSINNMMSSSSSSTSSTSGYTIQADVKKVEFPFTDAWQFSGNTETLYKFKLNASVVANIQISLPGMPNASVTCRLFHVQDDGFSPEYYLGYQEKNNCYLLTALTAGNYQLQLEATVQNAAYNISATVGQGDGNDGLSQALGINVDQVRTWDLPANDLEDWFVFTVKTDKEEGIPLSVNVVSDSMVNCLIYPWTDVDLYGFTGPACNQTYKFVSGTYYIRIGHGVARGVRQTYTVQVKSQ